VIKYSERAQRTVAEAFEEARRRGHAEVRPAHVLLACLSETPGIAGGVAQGALGRLGIDAAVLRAASEDALPPPAPAIPPAENIPFGTEARAAVVDHAGAAALALGHQYAGTEHLLLGLFAVPETAALLGGAGVDRAAFTAESLRLLAGA